MHQIGFIYKTVRLFSCNNNVALKKVGMPAETCWWEDCEWNISEILKKYILLVVCIFWIWFMHGRRHTLEYTRTFSNITSYKDDVSERVCIHYQGLDTQVAVCMAGSPVVRCLRQERLTSRSVWTVAGVILRAMNMPLRGVDSLGNHRRSRRIPVIFMLLKNHIYWGITLLFPDLDTRSTWVISFRHRPL